MSIDAISYKDLMHYKLQAILRDNDIPGLSYVGDYHGEHLYNICGNILSTSKISKFELR